MANTTQPANIPLAVYPRLVLHTVEHTAEGMMQRTSKLRKMRNRYTREAEALKRTLQAARKEFGR